MSNEDRDELILKRSIKSYFGMDVIFKQFIVMNVPVGPTAEASLFLTDKKQLFLYINAKSKLTLGDIRKIVSRMGLKAEIFLPPKGHSNYFDDVARKKFREVFPGRKLIAEDDLRFYRTLALYNPALILINEVKDSEIYRYDDDARSKWRLAAKFSYRRMKTS